MSHSSRTRARAPFVAPDGAQTRAAGAAASRRVAATRHAPHQVRLIGGIWKRTPLPVLDLAGLRPTPDRVRETLFNWLGQQLDGLVCLDLFAGTGALGFEAASRGAQRVMMVERDGRAAAQLNAIRQKLDAQMIEIVQADALRLAAGLAPAGFDIVFLDPPFNAELLGRALTLALPLVAPGGAVYVESDAPLAAVRDAQAQQGVAATPGWPSLQEWRIVRHARAGAVHYHLLRRENGE
ncbi:16S rRNA (guanine(966)-N(2))-methyltransferase RsmD [Mycetohabitans endofungorum]|uniref:16S rRNA (guanine(966)-N(2))-methyltransferase RsmD n=1 Tax=Mycetohabitans endofungorum TaxID=417203 RepID=UPI0030CFF6AC